MEYIATEDDIKRNLILFRAGKDLDMSLRKLGRKFKINALSNNKYNPIKPWNHICLQCKKEFLGIGKRKYCSKKCKRKLSNKNQYDYLKNKMETDWRFVLKVRLRDNLRDALRYYSKTGKFRKHKRSNKYIDYESIITKLGPCPGNRHEWHVDHIIPMCKFDFSKEEEIKKAFSPSNLRWLTAKENLKKNRY